MHIKRNNSKAPINFDRWQSYIFKGVTMNRDVKVIVPVKITICNQVMRLVHI